MNLADKIKTFFIVLFVCILYYLCSICTTSTIEAKKVYNVYLDGNLIGTIDNKKSLYNLIDKKQQVIKDRYKVDAVYPPNNLEIVENYSYSSDLTDINEIYDKIEELQDFTILGYEVKVNKTSINEDDESTIDESYSIYVLDKKVFTDAMTEFILAFISEQDLKDYLNGTQKELDDIGVNYQDMGIGENISIKQTYISVNDIIYQNSDTLAQVLLFGFDYNKQTYTVKEGDTIESISDDYTLNTQEFLIANPMYSSKDSLLKIGDTVNITLINPKLSFTYTIYEMKQVEYDYEKTTVRDNTKDSSYSEITQAGVKGLSIITSHYRVVNGEPDSETTIDNENVIRQKVDQITTKGKAVSVWGWNRYQDTGTGWRWPTANPYAITSEFAPRWGRYHNGIDISGSGFGSSIYAANDGVVTNVVNTCADNGVYGSKCGGGYGNNVVIDHGNNIYTLYGHLRSDVRVKVGQHVSRGTIIGTMGNSGSSKGTHLHFGFSNGDPLRGGTFRNPRELFQ